MDSTSAGNRRRPSHLGLLGLLLAGVLLLLINVSPPDRSYEPTNSLAIDWPASVGPSQTAIPPTLTQTPTPTPAPTPADPTAQPPLSILDWELVGRLEHDPFAWTQGLTFYEGRLYESVGLYGESGLRELDARSGEIIRQTWLDENYFAEGLAFLDEQVWLLTWREGEVLLFDPDTFVQKGSLRYAGEGWGLTSDGRELIMSDGSDELVWREKNDFTITRRLRVFDEQGPIGPLNELEWIDGFIWANIYQTSEIAVIDPASGRLVARLDFTELVHAEARSGTPDVMNGIAHDLDSGRILLTGKHWAHMYEIRLTGTAGQDGQ